MLFYPRGDEELRNATIVLRTAGDPEATIPAVRDLVRDVAADQPIATLKTGRQAVGETVADPRLLYVVMVSLAVVALTLGVVGIYGLVSFAVEQGRREIGLRIALGARAATVIIDVIRRGLVLGMAGVAIGLLGVVLLGRFVRSILFETPPTDPTVLAFAGGALLAACAAALVRPALNAASTDPARTLRSD
jgi:ABC-type antimicrobial peptide transport system permease subunit